MLLSLYSRPGAGPPPPLLSRDQPQTRGRPSNLRPGETRLPWEPLAPGDTGRAPEASRRSGQDSDYSQRSRITSTLLRKFQKSTNLLIPKLPFSRVIREICYDVRGKLINCLNSSHIHYVRFAMGRTSGFSLRPYRLCRRPARPTW